MTIIETQSAGVRIEGLNLSYDDTHVLKGIDLEIQQGEFFAFLGPSGSGKSSLLRAIAGFGPAPGGIILIGGDDVTRLPPWKRNVGMVFQNYALWPHMTVRKNVAFGLEERKINKQEIVRRVDEALEMVGLLDLAERRPSQLSGGQQQRIALARTIVIQPRVLLLDEPLSNLDANLRVQMRRDIRDLQQKLKLTTIFVTHDQEEANTISDRMAVLHDGVIQQIGVPQALYDDPVNLFVANFLGTANMLSGQISVMGGQTVFRSEGGITFILDSAQIGERTIVFRPQNVAISVDKVARNKNQARLRGKIRNIEFLGGIVRYAVDVAGDIILVEEQHQKGAPVHSLGTSVDLLIARDQIMVLTS